VSFSGSSGITNVNPHPCPADNSAVTVCALPEPVVEQSRTRARGGMGALIGVCFVSALVGRLSYLVRPFNADGAMFIYMGKLVSQGGRIGYELIDNKFPTVGLITSPCWKVFGNSWPGYVLLQLVLTLIGAYLLARAAERNIGKYATLPTGLFALVYLNFNFAVFGGFQLETLQAFFSILAATAAIEAIGSDDARDSFLTGLATGVAAMVKPSGLAVLAAFGIAILFSRRRMFVHAVAAAAGLGIPFAATFAYLQAADLLAILPAIWRQIADYAANSPWEPWDLSKPVIVILILGFPMLVRGYIFRRPRHREAIRPDRIIAFFAILWLAFEAAGIVAQRRMYSYHFLVLAAPASLLFGLIPRNSRPVPLAAALIAPALFSIFGGIQVLADAPGSMLPTASEEYLTAHAQPGDAVWLDGMMRLLIWTDLQPGSRYPMTFLWVNDDDAPLRYAHAMVSDFEERRPKYIVLPTKFDHYVRALSERIKELGLRPQRKANFIHAWSLLREYVLNNYHAEANADWETIYRRDAN
jgi:hypothetical protein